MAFDVELQEIVTGPEVAGLLIGGNGVAIASVSRAPAVAGLLIQQGADLAFSDLTVEVVTFPDFEHVADLTLTRDRRFQDVLNETGDGEFFIQADDPSFALLAPGQLAVMRYRGFAALSIFLQTYNRVALDPDEEAAHGTRWAGLGSAAVLNRALVYPSRGAGRYPKEVDRVFNWTAPGYDDSGWGAAKFLISVGGAKSSWLVPFDSAFPDDDASVLWGDKPGDTPSSLTNAPVGAVYFRQSFNVGVTGYYKLFALADNYMEVHIDGQYMLSVPGFSEGTMSTVQFTMSGGDHTLAAYGSNLQGSATNPAGVAWVLYRTDQYGEVIGLPVARSDLSVKAVPYPANPPGMTVGRVIRLVVEEAQARDWLEELELGFTDLVDSRGDAWPVVADIATRVGTDLLTFLRELSGTYIDFWIEPLAWRLHAWRKDGPGRGSSFEDVVLSNVTSYLIDGDAAALSNVLLTSWRDGWHEGEDVVAIGLRGRQEAFLEVGSLASAPEVIRVEEGQLEVFNHPREQVTLNYEPVAANRPYLTYNVGDRIQVPSPEPAPMVQLLSPLAPLVWWRFEGTWDDRGSLGAHLVRTFGEGILDHPVGEFVEGSELALDGCSQALHLDDDGSPASLQLSSLGITFDQPFSLFAICRRTLDDPDDLGTGSWVLTDSLGGSLLRLDLVANIDGDILPTIRIGKVQGTGTLVVDWYWEFMWVLDPIPAGEWLRIAFTYSPTSLTFGVNGVMQHDSDPIVGDGDGDRLFAAAASASFGGTPHEWEELAYLPGFEASEETIEAFWTAEVCPPLLGDRVYALALSEDVDNGRAIVTPTLRDWLFTEGEKFAQNLKKLANGGLQGGSKIVQPSTNQAVTGPPNIADLEALD